MMREPRLNCVDMSKWGGELSAGEAAAMWEMGIRNIKVGVGYPGPGGAGEWSRQQAQAFLAVNPAATVDAYVYLYFAGDAGQQTGQAIRTLDGIPIRRWWLDAEDTDSPALSPSDRERFLVQCTAAMAGLPVGIYTARWWWPSNMADSPRFGDLPLWNSWYDGDPDTDGLPYGGWAESAVEQYEGTTDVAGQSVDLNYDKTLDVPAEEENPVNQTELEDLILSTWAGAEERYTALEAKQLGDTSLAHTTKPRDVRLAIARERMAERVTGGGESVVSYAGSIAAAAAKVVESGQVKAGMTADEVQALILADLAAARIVVGV